MEQSRINAILDLLDDPALSISLSGRPEEIDKQYIASQIALCCDALKKVNRLKSEVTVALAKANRELRQHRTTWTLLHRDQMIVLYKQRARGTITERKALASEAARIEYAALVLEERARKSGSPITFDEARKQASVWEDAPNLEEMVISAEDTVERIRAISTVLEDRRQELAKNDSAIRLQARAYEIETRAFGGHGLPRQPTGPDRRGKQAIAAGLSAEEYEAMLADQKQVDQEAASLLEDDAAFEAMANPTTDGDDPEEMED